MAFQLRSIDFSSGQIIPDRFSAQELGVNPALTWTDGPSDAAEYALICEDPDAPLPKPFVHWILYGLEPDLHFIPDRLPKKPKLSSPISAQQGLNSLQEPGFTGPNPPFWDGVHRYVFRLFALKEKLELPSGAGRQEFLQAIDGKVLGEAQLIGLYEKPLHRRLGRGARSAGLLTAGVGVAGAGFLWIHKRLVAREPACSPMPLADTPSKLERKWHGDGPHDRVEEASWESFPASDPPAY